MDSSKPTCRQNRCCKNGSDHRFRFPSGPLLGFWYELAITGAPVKNYEQTKALIDADQQRLRKLIWPEADKQ
nr:hypothetical protein [uncultured Enterobacter sp.]